MTKQSISTVFDTINHSVLLKWFEKLIGITGSALEWLKSYFHGMEQFVHVKDVSLVFGGDENVRYWVLFFCKIGALDADLQTKLGPLIAALGAKLYGRNLV